MIRPAQARRSLARKIRRFEVVERVFATVADIGPREDNETVEQFNVAEMREIAKLAKPKCGIVFCQGCPDCRGIRNTPEEDAAIGWTGKDDL